jgi:hypothetical protein
VYSKGHALVSAVVGVAVAPFAPSPAAAALGWAWVVGLGVGVDVDHFAIARLNRGDWANLGAVLADPRLAVAGQREIFAPGDVWRDQRLLSHVLLAGALTGGAWLAGPFPALATGASLYAHVAADLAADVRTHEAYVRAAAAALDDES